MLTISATFNYVVTFCAESMMKLTVVALVALLVIGCAALRPKWHQLESYTFANYVQDFHKTHIAGTTEYTKREAIFNAKLASVKAFNKEGHSWKKGINRMSDWTAEEVRGLNGRIPTSQAVHSAPKHVFEAPKDLQLPLSIDYRMNFPPVLTAVKDQGMCGSCWAHAATESIETHYAMATGQLFVLSQQQITSCTPNPQKCGGTGGCFGATAEIAWDYVTANGGITEEWMYSYSSYFGDSGLCTLNMTKQVPVAFIDGYASVKRNSDSDTAAALVANGPMAISVDASEWSEYESGVYSGCNYANNISMDHAVQLIGYGHDDSLNVDYWLVRNSWSAGWGEDGYIRLLRDQECGNNVDWNTMGGGCPNITNNTVWACGQCGILYDVVYPIAKPTN